MLLNVSEVKQTKSGKSVVVKADGKDYFAKPDQGIRAGTTIEAETEDSEYQGKVLVWIKAWKLAAQESRPTEGKAGALAPSPAFAWLPMASNVVAHAIAAGKIESPDQVKSWVLAVREAVENEPSAPF